MINPEDESMLRLLVFGVALVAIASRESTIFPAGGRILDHLVALTRDKDEGRDSAISDAAAVEARAIANAVVSEAQRLRRANCKHVFVWIEGQCQCDICGQPAPAGESS